VSLFVLLIVNFSMWLYFVLNIIVEVSAALRIRVFSLPPVTVQPKQAAPTPTPAPTPAAATLALPAATATSKSGKTKTK
jgi:hypothetical protein